MVISAAHCFRQREVTSRWKLIAGHLRNIRPERRGIRKQIRRIETP